MPKHIIEDNSLPNITIGGNLARPMYIAGSPSTQAIAPSGAVLPIGYVATAFSLSEQSFDSRKVTSLTLNNIVGMPSFTFNQPALRTLSCPVLTVVFGALSITSALTSLSLPSLKYVNGALGFGSSGVAFVSSINCPELEYVGGNISLTSLSITTATFPKVKEISGLAFISNLPITTLDLPALEVLLNGVNAPSGLTNLTTVRLGTSATLKYCGSNISITGAALSAQSIENILTALAALDGTNGTTAFSSPRTINLSGGTSSGLSALTSAASTARSTLVARGVTVTLNA